MTPLQQALLKRILASRQFASADSLKRILRYLCQHASTADAQVKEYDIAVDVLGRQRSFDPKLDPIVRVNIASIRERLRAYFETEGRDEALHLDIPKGQYRVTFHEANKVNAPAHQTKLVNPALHKFWQPYLSEAYVNQMVFTELLFFRNDEGTYIRNIYVNDINAGREQLQERVSGHDIAAYKPSFHFVSAGEMHCMLSLTRMFGEIGARVEAKNTRFSSWSTLRNSNLILIGSSRTNSFLDSVQGGNNFLITADRIENLNPQPGEERFYIGTRHTDGKLEKVREYAVVTRQPGLIPNCFITTVAGNHGRAIEGAGDFLSTETRVQTLLHLMNLAEARTLPAHFQIILRIDMIDFDEEVAQTEYLTHRIISE